MKKLIVLILFISTILAIPSFALYDTFEWEFPGKIIITWQQDIKTRQVVYAKFKFYDDVTGKWIENKPLRSEK